MIKQASASLHQTRDVSRPGFWDSGRDANPIRPGNSAALSW